MANQMAKSAASKVPLSIPYNIRQGISLSALDTHPALEKTSGGC